MTIGDVISALEKASGEAVVRFDFGGTYPTTVDSWRGAYDEAAIGFSSDRYADTSVTVEEVLAELHSAIDGREYGGWKGGSYRYTRDTPLHVDNRGCYSQTDIDRVQVEEWQVVIHTKYEG